jgi:hypothetical protein
MTSIRPAWLDDVAAVLAAALFAHFLLISLSEALGRWYRRRLVPAVMVPAAVHPLAVLADELAPLSRRHLQRLFGARRNVAKAELISAALVLA